MAVYAVGPDGPGDAVPPLLALSRPSLPLFQFPIPISSFCFPLSSFAFPTALHSPRVPIRVELIATELQIAMGVIAPSASSAVI